ARFSPPSLRGAGSAVDPAGAGRVTLGGPAGEVIPVSEAPAVPATPVSPVDVVPVAVEDPERAGLGTHDRIAYDILANIGGAANVKRVLHCITRVRFYLRDEGIADDAAVAGIDGVIDIAKAGGQYQVVIGPGVEDVYNAIVARMGGGGAAAVDENEEDEPKPDTALGWVKYGFSQLIGVITGSMIPVVGVMAASGILKGLLALLTQFNVVAGDSDTYRLISAMSDSMFFFLPMIIGFTAAKRLGSNPIIVAIIGGVMVYPAVVEMARSDTVIAQIGKTVFNAEFLGIPISIPSGNAYAYSIFPIIVAAWLAARIEPWLKRILPAVIHSIFAPLFEIFIVSTLIFVVFGPIIMMLSGGLAQGINGLIDVSYPISGLLIGGLYQCLVIFGLHWAVIPLIASQIAAEGSSPLNAIVSATMVAQGGGALAIWVKTKQAKIKSLAGPATISAFCGITEPAMYGLNLKYGKVFITASIGGAVGGLLTGLFDVNMYGFTGAFVGFPSFVNPDGLDGSFVGFWVASLAALAVSFTLTYLYGFKDADLEGERAVKKVRLGRRDPVA
ncbi:MAG TPA: PTS transporter subunit EIIC, partial [Arachnia sp.]|nr:PTS transporter subunit EIIC [Arachnia sp.]